MFKHLLMLFILLTVLWLGMFVGIYCAFYVPQTSHNTTMLHTMTELFKTVWNAAATEQGSMEKLDFSTLPKLYYRTVRAVRGLDECSRCNICLEDYMDAETVMLLDCGHCFHWACGLPWFNHTRSCPSCRHECSGYTAVQDVNVRVL